MTWTPERIDRLKQMWADGYSYGAIASRLGGTTRNAVSGKVHRLNLSGRAKPEVKRPKKRRAPRKVTKDPNHMARRIEARLKAKPLKEPPPSPESKMVPLMDLEFDSCRWPIGDPKQPGFGFCGVRQKGGSSYCKYHSRLAYRPKEERRPRTDYTIKRVAA